MSRIIICVYVYHDQSRADIDELTRRAEDSGCATRGAMSRPVNQLRRVEDSTVSCCCLQNATAVFSPATHAEGDSPGSDPGPTIEPNHGPRTQSPCPISVPIQGMRYLLEASTCYRPGSSTQFPATIADSGTPEANAKSISFVSQSL